MSMVRALHPDQDGPYTVVVSGRAFDTTRVAHRLAGRYAGLAAPRRRAERRRPMTSGRITPLSRWCMPAGPRGGAAGRGMR